MSDQILITGSSGFVGRHLTDLLGAAAVSTEVDVTDFQAVSAVTRETQPSAVVHLAAISGVGESWRDPARVWEVNAVGTVNVLEAVRHECPRARVLFASTGEVYGRADRVPTPEDAPVAPVSPYGASKAAAELACIQARETDLDVTIARAFQHEGPGRDDRFAVGSWARQIAELELAGGGALRVGNLDASRDVLDVRDVCRAYRLMLEPSVEGDFYNVATGRPVAMTLIVDLLVELARCPVSVEPDPDRLRPVEIPVLSGDPSRIRGATGWEAEIPLEQTLVDTLDAARQSVQVANV